MSLNVGTLNVGRLLQERTRAYLERVSMGTEPIPDVMCIQDIPFRDLGMFEWAPHIAFAPMTNHLINGVRAVVGIAIVSRYFMTDIAHYTVWGDGKLKDIKGVNDQNQRRFPTAENDEVINSTEDRVVVCATVCKDGMEYNIATTHGMWVRDGVTNDVQRQCMTRLRNTLIGESYRRRGMVLAGDMNFNRGGEVYKMFTLDWNDCVPFEVDNTLDPDHPVVRKGIKVVTDYVMTHKGHNCDNYTVTDVRLQAGVSDHCVLSATVSRQ